MAIVIFYDGTKIDTATAENLLAVLAKHIKDDISSATIKVFDENDMSSELIKSIVPPIFSTESGDAAVKVIMSILPVEAKTNKLKCCVTLAKMLSKAEFKNDTKSQAFIHAMSILSQNNPVSDTVAVDWNFTPMIRESIKETYKLFINE